MLKSSLSRAAAVVGLLVLGGSQLINEHDAPGNTKANSGTVTRTVTGAATAPMESTDWLIGQAAVAAQRGADAFGAGAAGVGGAAGAPPANGPGAPADFDLEGE